MERGGGENGWADGLTGGALRAGPDHPQKPFVEQLLAASIGARELKRAAIEPNPNKLSAWSAPGRPPKGNGANLHNSFTWREAAALLRVSGRTVAHAARVLSEDSPAAPAVRLAVEQGRVTVSDASRVMDEPAEVQLRALERVTGGGSRNLAGAAQGLPPGGWIAEVGEVIGGAGPTPWRVWRTPARWVSPAGADMGEVRRWWCQVRTSALVTLGVGWGLLRAGYRLRPGERLRGGKRGTGRTAPRAALYTLSRRPGEARRAAFTVLSTLSTVGGGGHTRLETALPALSPGPGDRAG